MRSPDTHFFCESLELGSLTLNPEESRHLVRTCRALPGASLTLADGKGRFAQGLLTAANPDAATVQVKALSDAAPKPKLHLALGCLDDDDMESVVFHCAQTSLASICFLRTERSLEPKKSNLERAMRRCKSKSLVALKQAKKPWLTDIIGPVALEEWTANITYKLIVCNITNKLNNFKVNTEEEYCLVTGPEGGFSEKELELFAAHGAEFLSLGDTRLRAVTAPLYGLGQLNALATLSAPCSLA
jgi:16S rRNA (uracil1498-N3)-methyltransferase